MKLRRPTVPELSLFIIAAAMLIFAFLYSPDRPKPPQFPKNGKRPIAATSSTNPLPGEALLVDFASPDTPPIDDLRSLHHVLSGYFSVVKSHEKFPIGGNEDLAAALRGENANQQPFLPRDHSIFGPDGRLVDRWSSPIFVHPLAEREIELRSAGPDRQLFTPDDLILSPNGLAPSTATQ